MGKFKAAFMFVTPDSDPKIHKTSVSTPEVLDYSGCGRKRLRASCQSGGRAG